MRNAADVLPADRKGLFDHLIGSGKIWKDIVHEFVTSAGQNSDLSHEKLMEELIKYRDALDCEIYQEAIRKLFPRDYYTVKADPDGFVERNKDGKVEFKSKWYVIKIFNGPDAGFNFNSSAPHAEITIKAPGSRNLTSDIDTTVNVFGAENLDFTHAAAEVKNQGDDYNGLLEVAVVKNFYEISQSRHKMTSGENRDSNVYVGDFATGYPKFIDDDEGNVTIAGKPLIANVKEFYSENKKNKHIYEMAASLVSLIIALKPEEWQAFKAGTFIKIDKLFGQDKQNVVKAKQDLERIFAKADEYVAYYKVEFNRELNLKKQTEYARISPLVADQSKWEKDISVSTLNDLYVVHLKQVITINNEISLQKNKIQLLKKSVESQLQSSEEARAGLKELEAINSENKFVKEIITTAQQKCAERQELYTSAVKELTAALRQLAKLKNQKQDTQIRARLFANEAYINRSAPYHVVTGMQSNTPITMTIHVLIGSLLQQLGFRLLHSEEQRKEGASEGEIANKNSKYGQRMADVVFGQSKQSYADEEVEAIGEFNSLLTILPALSTANVHFDRFMGKAECQLLNSEVRMVTAVRKADSIREADKGNKAAELLALRAQTITENPINGASNDALKQYTTGKEKELFLSIGQKALAAGFFAKVKKGALWGEARKGASPALTPSASPATPKAAATTASPTIPKTTSPYARTPDAQAAIASPSPSPLSFALQPANIGVALARANVAGDADVRADNSAAVMDTLSIGGNLNLQGGYQTPAKKQ